MKRRKGEGYYNSFCHNTTKTGKWISVGRGGGEEEVERGVLWCGALAAEVSGGKICEGWHRVAFSEDNRDRHTVWYEVADISQFPQKLRLPVSVDSFILKKNTKTGTTGVSLALTPPFVVPLLFPVPV